MEQFIAPVKVETNKTELNPFGEYLKKKDEILVKLGEGEKAEEKELVLYNEASELN